MKYRNSLCLSVESWTWLTSMLFTTWYNRWPGLDQDLTVAERRYELEGLFVDQPTTESNKQTSQMEAVCDEEDVVDLSVRQGLES